MSSSSCVNTMATLFGTHTGITCDGCGHKPIEGFRMKCTKCVNHDYCEECYEKYQGGVVNDWSKAVNPVSKKPEDHEFEQFADREGFKAAGKKEEAAVKVKKVKPNEPCPCGSGKKFKKCCGAGAA
mmetsp:Transcript_53180/g.168854  ORF Transcript_53180/g.168854 Transcript_53180/m.168854 type:complete len:126 (-) Transcript_53180:1804-2181(-)